MRAAEGERESQRREGEDEALPPCSLMKPSKLHPQLLKGMRA